MEYLDRNYDVHNTQQHRVRIGIQTEKPNDDLFVELSTKSLASNRFVVATIGGAHQCWDDVSLADEVGSLGTKKHEVGRGLRLWFEARGIANCSLTIIPPSIVTAKEEMLVKMQRELSRNTKTLDSDAARDERTFRAGKKREATPGDHRAASGRQAPPAASRPSCSGSTLTREDFESRVKPSDDQTSGLLGQRLWPARKGFIFTAIGEEAFSSTSTSNVSKVTRPSPVLLPLAASNIFNNPALTSGVDQGPPHAQPLNIPFRASQIPGGVFQPGPSTSLPLGPATCVSEVEPSSQCASNIFRSPTLHTSNAANGIAPSECNLRRGLFANVQPGAHAANGTSGGPPLYSGLAKDKPSSAFPPIDRFVFDFNTPRGDTPPRGLSADVQPISHVANSNIDDPSRSSNIANDASCGTSEHSTGSAMETNVSGESTQTSGERVPPKAEIGSAPKTGLAEMSKSDAVETSNRTTVDAVCNGHGGGAAAASIHSGQIHPSDVSRASGLHSADLFAQQLSAGFQPTPLFHQQQLSHQQQQCGAYFPPPPSHFYNQQQPPAGQSSPYQSYFYNQQQQFAGSPSPFPPNLYDYQHPPGGFYPTPLQTYYIQQQQQPFGGFYTSPSPNFYGQAQPFSGVYYPRSHPSGRHLDLASSSSGSQLSSAQITQGVSGESPSAKDTGVKKT